MPENIQQISKRTSCSVVRFLLVVALLITISIGAVMVGIRPASLDPGSLSKIVEIKPGMGAGAIARLLNEEGLIKNPFVFRLVVRTLRFERTLQAGHYLLSPKMGALEIIDHLRFGDVTTRKVVIPEGFEIKQIAAVLANKDLVDPNRFIELASNASLVFGDNIPVELPIDSLEGYLFPDTYNFGLNQSEEDIIGQMVDRFLQVVNGQGVLELVEQSDFTLHEAVTLASIVEREIMVHDERPIVASVYLNRLAIDMPLQADPTVRYVMTEERSRVLYRDLEIDSPYNTYRNKGLPPGPIASPGLASIKAVFSPAETNYLFFISRRDGTHQFSETYNEHLQARRTLGY